MELQRTVLKELPEGAGSIDLVWDGAFSRVEFNSNCLDALPLCKGMCCRMRVGYSVEIEEDEEGYETREHPSRPGVNILKAKDNGLSCFYLDEQTNKCSIHERRPRMCRQWHCSPGGNVGDTEIIRRDAGWMLMPMRKEEADMIQRAIK